MVQLSTLSPVSVEQASTMVIWKVGVLLGLLFALFVLKGVEWGKLNSEAKVVVLAMLVLSAIAVFRM